MPADPLLGEIMLVPYNFAPRGWAFCQGQILSISQNTALFSLLGTTWGGNGQTTFALPDLRGRTTIGTGPGPGLTNRALGETGGVEQFSLSASNLPPHAHTLPNTTCTTLTVGAGPGLSSQTLGQIGGTEDSTLTVAQMPAHQHSIDPPGSFTGTTGNNQPQGTMQPTLALHPVIALEGIFPSRGGGSGSVDEPLLGQIDLFAGNFAPSGWAFCDGQILSIAQNTALFSLLGTTYGGNGQTTFALPDLGDRLAVDFGQGLGLSNVDLGQSWGTESVTLNESQLAAHTNSY